MAEPAAVKRALARLAAGRDGDRAVIEAADAARGDLEAAAAFRADVGLARLAVAIERQRRLGREGLVARGERARESFRRFRAAASGGGVERATSSAPVRKRL
jgi:hypothetical protein